MEQTGEEVGAGRSQPPAPTPSARAERQTDRGTPPGRPAAARAALSRAALARATEPRDGAARGPPRRPPWRSGAADKPLPFQQPVPCHPKKAAPKMMRTPCPPRGAQEDRLLTKLIRLYGTRNWSIIAAGIKGRSGKSCRLRCELRRVTREGRGAGGCSGCMKWLHAEGAWMVETRGKWQGEAIFPQCLPVGRFFSGWPPYKGLLWGDLGCWGACASGCTRGRSTGWSGGWMMLQGARIIVFTLGINISLAAAMSQPGAVC
eukprot:353985-Chlamydomonas_euryale.AAC.4